VEDAEEIKKLNNFEFAGAVITVEDSTEGLSNTSQEIKTRLSGVLSQRYHSDTKLLNLSDLGQDATLKEMDMLNKASPEKLFRALMVIVEENFKTAQAKREGVVSVSLAGNNIDDVQQIMPLADTFPDLLNLDLSRNQFKDLNGLRRWSHRFRKLETLFLQGNPIAADTSYMGEVTKWFPKLQNLSETQVRTKEEIQAAQQAPKVFPIPQCGSDFRDVNQIGEAFITEFFAMFDNDRQNLAAKYYDEQSTFSFSVMTSAYHMPDTPAPSWGQYIRLSRNHVKINHQSARYQRLFVGTSLVQNAWAKLPPTQHPNLTAQFDKYLIDCHPMTGLADPTGQSLSGVDGMVITMHGEFDDLDTTTNKTTKRSFSRSFILGPGKPGRNPIRVVSDMWQLRAHSPLPAQTGPLPPQTGVQEAAPTNPEAQKEQMAAELCKQTGMTLEYSKMCLDVAGWNFDQALVTFNEKRVSILLPLYPLGINLTG
jgi:nuclear RNA export factor